MPPNAKKKPSKAKDPVVLVSREPGLGPGLRRFERALRAEVQGILTLIQPSTAVPALSVHLCTNRTIARLNRRWLNRAGATNVISFQSPDLRAGIGTHGPVPLRRGSLRRYAAGRSGEMLLGDLAIGIERARSESRRAGTDPVDWTAALAHHGLMHILGYSHRTMPPRRRRW